MAPRDREQRKNLGEQSPGDLRSPRVTEEGATTSPASTKVALQQRVAAISPSSWAAALPSDERGAPSAAPAASRTTDRANRLVGNKKKFGNFWHTAEARVVFMIIMLV